MLATRQRFYITKTQIGPTEISYSMGEQRRDTPGFPIGAFTLLKNIFIVLI